MQGGAGQASWISPDMEIYERTRCRAILIGWPCVVFASVPTISEEPLQGSSTSSNRSQRKNHERGDFPLKRLRLSRLSSTRPPVAQCITISPQMLFRAPQILSVGPPPFPLIRSLPAQYIEAVICSKEGTNISHWKNPSFSSIQKSIPNAGHPLCIIQGLKFPSTFC